MGKKLLDEYGKERYDLDEYKSSLKDKDIRNLDIIKVERPVEYETIFERKEEILDETEKRYLTSVIRPFRDKVRTIEKTYPSGDRQIVIHMRTSEDVCLPRFTDRTMYKNMKTDEEYTLEELGL